MKSFKEFISCNKAEKIDALLNELQPKTVLAMPYMFSLWAHSHQIPPEQDYRNWVLMGGRGAGKTRAGAEWVRALVEGAKPEDGNISKRIALIGQSLHEVQEVMIFGPSGIMESSPPDRRPHWNGSRKRLEWKNGALAYAYSANNPEALRGPQFDAAWLDEFAKWPKAHDVWDMLQFCLRLGDAPKVMITTTPRRKPILEKILELPDTVLSQAPTHANHAHLPASFLKNLEANYLNTSLAQEEIHGQMLTNCENALWQNEDFRRIDDFDMPFDRIVVSIDPSVSSKSTSDETGIIVAGAIYPSQDPRDWKAVILEDASLGEVSPDIWSLEAFKLYHQYEANLIVAEVNQGGELVESMLRTHDPYVNFHPIHARHSKSQRAEAVSALYKQGRVEHLQGLQKLEAQMMEMGRHGFEGKGSPDRVDACVWALQVLLIDALKTKRPYQIRNL